MKKIFLTIPAAILIASFSFAGIVITTTVTIGKKSQNCSGFGICSATRTSSYMQGSINGTLTVNEGNGSIIVGINKSDLLINQPEKLAYFEAGSDVSFSEDFTFPEEINTAAKAAKPIVIKKGVYPVTLSKGMYYIEIPM